MAHIQIANTSFYYECEGKGQPLVLVAGYSCDHTFWDDIFEELANHFQVIIFDNRGMGQTHDLTTHLTLELMANDTIELIRALNLKDPILLGQSMGGIICQIIAQKYPQELGKLIILNSAFKVNSRTLFVLESLLNLFKKGIDFDLLMDSSMPWFYSGNFLIDVNKVKQYKTSCLNNAFPPTPEILARQLMALKSYNPNHFPKTYHVPTLVVGAKDDIICLPQESKELSLHIPDAQLITIEGGHSSPIENPNEIIKMIIDFGKQKRDVMQKLG